MEVMQSLQHPVLVQICQGTCHMLHICQVGASNARQQVQAVVCIAADHQKLR